MQKQSLTKSEKKETFNISLDTKKEIAKIGMTATMGITVVTSFYMKNKVMKNLHIGAGAALVGFSLWHHYLYQPEKKEAKIQKEKKLPENT